MIVSFNQFVQTLTLLFAIRLFAKNLQKARRRNPIESQFLDALASLETTQVGGGIKKKLFFFSQKNSERGVEGSRRI